MNIFTYYLIKLKVFFRHLFCRKEKVNENIIIEDNYVNWNSLFQNNDYHDEINNPMKKDIEQPC